MPDTTVQIALWHLITLLLAFFSCVGIFGKVLLRQIEKRIDEKFSAQAITLKGTADKVEKLEREFLEWRADLPIHYVRREDYVRGQTVIEAKLDALYNKLEVVQLKGAR